MSDICIEILAGPYEDFNTYHRLLNYIGQKTYVGGYGFYLDPNITIVEQFQLSEACSQHKSLRKMWHFAIIFPHHWKHEELLYIGNNISEIFKKRLSGPFRLRYRRRKSSSTFWNQRFQLQSMLLSTDQM